MMKKILLVTILVLCGCTENARTKVIGGTQTINVPAGQKVFDVTWKDANIWYATRPFREGEVPETVTFHNKSNYGILEGKVIFKESN